MPYVHRQQAGSTCTEVMGPAIGVSLLPRLLSASSCRLNNRLADYCFPLLAMSAVCSQAAVPIRRVVVALRSRRANSTRLSRGRFEMPRRQQPIATRASGDGGIDVEKVKATYTQVTNSIPPVVTASTVPVIGLSLLCKLITGMTPCWGVHRKMYPYSDFPNATHVGYHCKVITR